VPEGIMRTNAFGVDIPSAQGSELSTHRAVFLNTSRCNHRCVTDYRFYLPFAPDSDIDYFISCVPNATWRWDYTSFSLQLKAVRPISAGEEITIQYLSGIKDGKSRRERLRYAYNFECRCFSCCAELGIPLPQKTKISGKSSKDDERSDKAEKSAVKSALKNESGKEQQQQTPEKPVLKGVLKDSAKIPVAKGVRWDEDSVKVGKVDTASPGKPKAAKGPSPPPLTIPRKVSAEAIAPLTPSSTASPLSATSSPTFEEWCANLSLPDNFLIEKHMKAMDKCTDPMQHRAHVDTVAMCYGALADKAMFRTWLIAAKACRGRKKNGGFEHGILLDLWFENPSSFPVWGWRKNATMTKA
jgi:hypothetical protein